MAVQPQEQRNRGRGIEEKKGKDVGEKDLGRGGRLHPVLLILELITVCKLLKKDLKEFKPTTFLDVINNRYAYFMGKFITESLQKQDPIVFKNIDSSHFAVF